MDNFLKNQINKGTLLECLSSLAAIALFWIFALPVVLNAQISSKNFIYDGLTRNYLVFLPQAYSSTANLPVVINLHGYGSTAAEQFAYTRMHLLADTSGFIVVYPNAFNTVWNSGISDNPNAPAPDVDDVGFIDALIDTLSANYGIDLERVYACGMSNGGFMSFKLACQLSQRIAAVASVTGVLANSTASDCNAEYAIPILHIHGTSDQVVPFAGAQGWLSVEQTLAHWRDNSLCGEPDTTAIPDINTADNSTVEKIMYTNCSGTSEVVFYKVHNGGHTWPGAAFNLPNRNTNRDINANIEIWDFFKEHTLPSSVTDIKTPDETSLPSRFILHGNYPNPFNPSTKIRFSLPRASEISLKIFDLQGNEIAALFDGLKQAGTHELSWRAGHLPSGVYFYRLQAAGVIKTGKMLLVK